MILERVSKQDVFYSVDKQQLIAQIDNKSIYAPYYTCLIDKDRIVGIKSYSNNFFVENKTVYNAFLKFTQKLDLGIDSEKIFSNDNKNKCFLFLGYSKMSSLSDHEIIEKLWNRGFKPAFAFVNGYDYNDKLVFYALLEQTIDRNTSGYLTIAKLALTESVKNQIMISPHDAYYILMEELEKYAENYFLKAFSDFINKYDKLIEIEATEKELTAITLDIYNKNRNIEAITSDSNLERELKNFISDCRDYYISVNATNLSYILKYIVRYQQINFDYTDIKASEIKQALQEKKVYKKNINRLYKGKNAVPKELKKYIYSQIKVLDEVIKIL